MIHETPPRRDVRTVPGRTDHVVVVGAGLAGLSAALHLLGAGRRVTILERDAHPGGRAGRLDLDTPQGRYRVDTGPTVFTMPGLLEAALDAVGERLTDRLDLVALHPAYRARFADGSTIDVHTDPDAMEAEIRATCGAADAAGYRRLRGWLTRLYRAEIDSFIGANFDSPLDLVGPDLARLAALGGFGRLGPRIARLLPDERLQRILSFQSLYAGVAPQHALAAYGVIAYMDTVAGVWFPRGGMRRVGQAMADAAQAAGAEIRYRTAAIGLERRAGRVTGVRTEHDRVPCDTVVLTPDLPTVHRLLGRRPRRPLPLRWAPSAVVLHAGSTASWPDLDHHTILFGGAWRRTFRELVRDGRLMSDPFAAGHPADRVRPLAGPAGPAAVLRARAVPEHGHRCRRLAEGRTGIPRRARRDPAGPRADRLRRSGRDRAPGHPGGLGGGRPGRRHPVLRGAHRRPDRTVPTAEPGGRAGERGLGGLRHDARGRHPAGADFRAACCRTDHREQTRGAGSALIGDLQA